MNIQEINEINVTELNQHLYLERGIQYYEQGFIIPGLKCFELLVSKYKNINALGRLVNHYICVKDVNKLRNLLTLLEMCYLERATIDIAKIYFLLKNYEKALEYSLKGRSLHVINNYIIGVCYIKISKIKNISAIINILNDLNAESQELDKMVEKKTKYLNLAIEYLVKCSQNSSFKEYRNSCYYLGYCYLKKRLFPAANYFLHRALEMGEIRAATLLGHSSMEHQNIINSNYYFLIAQNYAYNVKGYKHLIKYLKMNSRLLEAIHTCIILLRTIKEERKNCSTESKNNKLRYIYEKHQNILNNLLIDTEINFTMVIEHEGIEYDRENFQILRNVSQEYLNN